MIRKHIELGLFSLTAPLSRPTAKASGGRQAASAWETLPTASNITQGSLLVSIATDCYLYQEGRGRRAGTAVSLQQQHLQLLAKSLHRRRNHQIVAGDPGTSHLQLPARLWRWHGHSSPLSTGRMLVSCSPSRLLSGSPTPLTLKRALQTASVQLLRVWESTINHL